AVQVLSTICLVLALISAVAFALLVLLTGKGDAMSGGGSVRTTYKGKATFDDIMSKATLYLGISFMGLVLLYNVFSVRATAANAGMDGMVPVNSPSTNEPSTNTPALNIPETPVTNAPSTNAPVTNAPVTNEPVTNTPTTNAPSTNTP
ncbi:MAG TPA: preprotein translocase subunit SecG, partial [Fimbriimonas sp.]|nr:preprotein translocase subunit SecG [Fimbriimonas sp.]